MTARQVYEAVLIELNKSQAPNLLLEDFNYTPNAIVYASGYIPITKMIKTGVIIDFVGIAFVTIPLVIYLVSWVVSIF